MMKSWAGLTTGLLLAPVGKKCLRIGTVQIVARLNQISKWLRWLLNANKNKQTPWFSWLPPTSKEKQVTILGAGLSGCYLARELAESGWAVQLIDEAAHLAARASANPQALLFPSLPGEADSALKLLLQRGYAFSQSVLKIWIERGVPGEQAGLIQHKTRRSQENSHCKSTLSQLAGFELSHPGLFFPEGGWIHLKAWCEALVQHPSIHLQFNTSIQDFTHQAGKWKIGEIETEVLILANGIGLTGFSAFANLPLKAVRGQLTWVESTPQSASLRLPISGSGHVLPELNGRHLVGATYDEKSGQHCDEESDQANLARLKQLIPSVTWSDKVSGHWADARAVTQDYLPMVGGVVDESRFLEQYASLKTDSKRWISHLPPCYPNLYIFTGFGSKGVTTIPLLATWFAALLNGGPSSLPQSLLKALSPARFYFRRLTRG